MVRYDPRLREEELKHKVAADWFAAFDTTRIIGNVDFCVAIPATELGLFEAENALWAEAKAGVRRDIHESFVQLILTIGRARTFDRERPPIFLGAFDAEKIAFLPCGQGDFPQDAAGAECRGRTGGAVSGDVGEEACDPSGNQHIRACLGETFYVRFTVREDASGGSRNELHGTAVSNVRLYKAEDAELSLRAHKHGEDSASLKASDTGRSVLSRTQGESPVPFVDNKIALFLSAVNGGAENDKNGQTGFVISVEARAVLGAGRELWRYYHRQSGANPNASYYDIRKHFQGVKVDAKGKEKMNSTSEDGRYSELLAGLKAAMKQLAAKIEPKVYEYGFLKR